MKKNDSSLQPSINSPRQIVAIQRKRSLGSNNWSYEFTNPLFANWLQKKKGGGWGGGGSIDDDKKLQYFV